MNNPFNPGDRVRYRAELVEQGFLHPRKLELTGKILRLPQGQGKCYLVKWNDVADSETTVHESWLESVPTSGRTFEEIINDLIADLNKLTEENDYGLREINTAGTAVLWYEPIPGEITYYDITQEGEFGTDKDYTFTPAAHLAAIAAACTEIAANYAAEHGKEEHQNG